AAAGGGLSAGAAGGPPRGRAPPRRADLLDAAFLGGTAAHGIELDDGYRQGSVHPGCAVVPAVLAVGYDMGATGKAAIEAIVAGYETAIAIAPARPPPPPPPRLPPTRPLPGVRAPLAGPQPP